MCYVLYLTNKCNLSCEYCYEKDYVNDKHTLSEKFLSDFIDNFNNEHDQSIVLFGGEPLLEIDKIKFIYKYIEDNKIEKKLNFSTTTNGILLQNEDTYNFIKSIILNKNFKLEISYDGHGNYRRKFEDGTKIDDILLNIFDRLNKDNVPFWISYTIHLGNYKYVIEDFIRLFEKYPICSGIIARIYYNEFKENDINIDPILEDIKNKCNYIYKKYYPEKPICDFVCDLCKLCHFENTKLDYHITDDKISDIHHKDDNSYEFKIWK